MTMLYSPERCLKPSLYFRLDHLLSPEKLTSEPPWPAPSGPSDSTQLLHYITPRRHITIIHLSVILLILILSLQLYENPFIHISSSSTTTDSLYGASTINFVITLHYITKKFFLFANLLSGFGTKAPHALKLQDIIEWHYQQTFFCNKGWNLQFYICIFIRVICMCIASFCSGTVI